MIRRVYEALAWRWDVASRLRFLKKNFRNGEKLVESYVKKTVCDTAVCNDGTIIRHPKGRTGLAGMILEIWHEQVYTSNKFYRPKRGDTIIDAGANVGLFSLLVAKIQPGCKVLAFEPFKENFQLLSENLNSAGVSSVQTLPMGLSGETGEAYIVDGGNRSQDHQLSKDYNVKKNCTSIRVCTLKEVIDMSGASTIDLFKCDIEGSEYGVFDYASNETLAKVKRYAIEYHDNIRPGTLNLIRNRLADTHKIDVHPSKEGYGMLYAVSKAA